MDGHFVPNISFGPDIVRALRPHSTRCFDTHLMIEPADPYLEAFARAGADRLTVHVEACPHLDRTLATIGRLGKSAGVSLNPATSETALAWVLDKIDLVLVMTVNPGFGGQQFIPAMLDKIARVRAMIAGRPIRLEVDGGIGEETAQRAIAAGADVLVAGSAIFGKSSYAAAIRALRPTLSC
jgi:ribulose-phosphate 3-epimerase